MCIDAHAFRFNPLSTPSKGELNLGRYITEGEMKALVIAVNKWDLIKPGEDQMRFRDEIIQRINQSMYGCFGDCPIVFTSATKNQNLRTLMDKILVLEKRYSARIPTGKLNNWYQAWKNHYPPPWKDGQKMQVKYMTQSRTRPPHFVMWTNTMLGTKLGCNKSSIPRHYLRQLTKAMKNEFNIQGTVVKIHLRTTCMPKPTKKMTQKDMQKWKRMGPKQAEAAMKMYKRRKKKPHVYDDETLGGRDQIKGKGRFGEMEYDRE